MARATGAALEFHLVAYTGTVGGVSDAKLLVQKWVNWSSSSGTTGGGLVTENLLASLLAFAEFDSGALDNEPWVPAAVLLISDSC